MKKYVGVSTRSIPSYKWPFAKQRQNILCTYSCRKKHLVRPSSSRTHQGKIRPSPSAPREKVAHHPARKVPRQTRSIHGIRRETGSMAELVAPGVRKRIRERQNKRDGCVVSVLPRPHVLISTHTNEREPDELKAHQRHNSKQDP